MTTLSAIGRLKELDQPILESAEAAAALGMTTSGAAKALKRAEDAGLARRLCRGLWSVESEIRPAALAPYLTAPYPAYVSLWSAMSKHEMIEQIPSAVHVASLSRTQEIDTALGRFSVHRIAPELFTGFDGTLEDGFWACPEKALFDTVYVRAPRGGAVRLPELSLPQGFDQNLLQQWTELIPRARLRTLVQRGLGAVIEQARQQG